jgi:hypothetical protein
VPLGVVALFALAGVGVFAWSGASLAADRVALARLDVQPLGGTLESAHARGDNGRPIPLDVSNGRLTPRVQLTPGERVSIDVVMRRPGWLGWARGDRYHEHVVLRAPAATVKQRWLTVRPGSRVRVTFDRIVSVIVIGSHGRPTRRLNGPRRSILVPANTEAGSVEIATAPRSWERFGTPEQISWFPPSRLPVVVSSPGPGARLTPFDRIRLTFSKPVAAVLGSHLPKMAPATAGHWYEVDSHTLVFVPRGLGTSLATDLQVVLPRPVAIRRSSAHGLRGTRRIGWTIPAGSLLRLQQLLAQAGYLPLDWTPSGSDVPRTPGDELHAAVDPPTGTFSWRYPNTPPELQALWNEGRSNTITRGAVMMFQNDHNLAVDGLAGPNFWRALLLDAIAGKRRPAGYSYVYVHRHVPQSLNLWHNGQVLLSSPGNTGVPAAPTQLGTFPVFEHISVGTMSGTNPDGSHYNDPGIRYISYFNHGDAIHAFNRSSFGTPQSLGCVELPLDAAAKVWPYTPIGTLVTIEN